MGSDNYLQLRNVYSVTYADVCVFMSSDLQIDSTMNDKILVKSIHTKVHLDDSEEVLKYNENS